MTIYEPTQTSLSRHPLSKKLSMKGRLLTQLTLTHPPTNKYGYIEPGRTLPTPPPLQVPPEAY
jgi:hypothetical protein